MERITPRTFKGTRDLLPEDMIQREELFEYLRKVYRRYGFVPLETPSRVWRSGSDIAHIWDTPTDPTWDAERRADPTIDQAATDPWERGDG